MAFAMEFQPVIDFAEDLLQRFQELDPEIKNMIRVQPQQQWALNYWVRCSQVQDRQQSKPLHNKRVCLTLGSVAFFAEVAAIALVAIPAFYA